MRRPERLRRPRRVPDRINAFAFLRCVMTGLVLICPARPVLALDEALVFDRMIDLYAQDISCDSVSTTPAWERGVVSNPNYGYRARYSRFGCPLFADLADAVPVFRLFKNKLVLAFFVAMT